MTPISRTRSRIVGGELESVGSNSLMALWMKAQPKINGVARWTVSNYNV